MARDLAKNWALVIGINDYNPLNFSRLNYARQDAERVKAFFDSLGFEVCLFTDNSPPLPLPNGVSIPTDPTCGNLVTFLEDRFPKGKTFLSTGDNCWFFFAGHGERHGDKDYLMPKDANSRGDKVISGLQVDEVREWLTRSGADNVILLLDACRNEGSRGGTDIAPAPPGVITIYSCNPSEKAWEIEELGQGAFTYALLEALQLPGESSCATVERLGNYLKHRVPDLCHRYSKPLQFPRVSVDPIEKQHFILMPQHARQADIDLMKAEGFRLAFENKLQLAEQLFIRANAAARGMDSKILDAITEVRIRLRGLSPQMPPTPPPAPQASRGAATAEAISVSDVAQEAVAPTPPSRPIPKPAPKPPAEEIPLESEKGVDYRKLCDLLKAGKWKEADKETAHRMLEAVGRKENDCILLEEIQSFPCKDLNIIDHLWVHYSQGRFGFSVQKKIWQDYGSPIGGEKDWDRFCIEVGWQTSDAKAYLNYSDLKFDIEESPTGELPLPCTQPSQIQLSDYNIWGGLGLGEEVAFIAQRLMECNSTSDVTKEKNDSHSQSVPKPPVEEILLESEKGVDYRKLRDLLKDGNWKAADRETADRMLEAVDRKENDHIQVNEIKSFPCKDLKTIDRLWMHYSQERFGFSVQKKIWQECSSPTSPGKDWDRFCVKVGWQTPDASAYVFIDALKFDSRQSPAGELPLLWVYVGSVRWWVVLFSRAENCEL